MMRFGSLLICMVVFFASSALAEGVPITPGKWEMKMTMEMTMLPAPQVRTYTECMEESELDPEAFNMDENSPCEIGEMQIEGNTVRWDMNCPTVAGDMTGSWEVTSEGETVTGSGSMSAEMAGQTMQFDMNWEGKRLGPCD